MVFLGGHRVLFNTEIIIVSTTTFCRCRQWVINCRRADLDRKPVDQLNRNFYLCAEHFESNQFANSLHNSLLWTAIPTLFNVANPPKQLISSRKPPACRQLSSSSYNIRQPLTLKGDKCLSYKFEYKLIQLYLRQLQASFII